MAKKLTIVIDAEDLASGKVKKVSASMNNAVDRSEKKSKGFMSKITGAMSKYHIVAGLATGATVAFAAKMLNLASSSQEVANKFNVVFKGVDNVSTRLQALREESGYASSSLQEMASNLGDLIKPAGFAAENAYDLSEQIVRLSLDLGSFNNLRPQDVVRDFSSALAGSSETLTKYGIDVKETTLAQQAYNMGLVNSAKQYAKLAPEEKRKIRTLALIKKATLDSKDAIGDLARTQNSYANQSKQLSENMKELGERLGTLIIPFMTQVVTVTNAAIKSMSKFLGIKTETDRRVEMEKELKVINVYIQRQDALNKKRQEMREAGFSTEERKAWREQVKLLRDRFEQDEKIKVVIQERLGFSKPEWKHLNMLNKTLRERLNLNISINDVTKETQNQNRSIIDAVEDKLKSERETANLSQETNAKEALSLDIMRAKLDLTANIRDSKSSIREDTFLTAAAEKEIASSIVTAKDNFSQISTYAEYTKFNLQAAGNTLAQIISMTRRKGGLKFSGILKIGSMIASLIPGGQAIGAGLGTAAGIAGAAGYQKGGSFIVPGKGDRDIPFIVPFTPGERVDVTPKGDTITNNNNTSNANINIGISANKIDESFVRIELVPTLRKVLRDYNISLQ